MRTTGVVLFHDVAATVPAYQIFLAALRRLNSEFAHYVPIARQPSPAG